jgi:hypothetical protein
MPESSIIKNSRVIRDQSLKGNVYKINSPYDLTNDLVSRGLDAIFDIGGIDLRFNPYFDLVERMIDAQNSKLVINSGERLAIEYGRRALMHQIDRLVKSDVLGDFKASDLMITDFSKDDSRTLTDDLLYKTIGYYDIKNLFDRYPNNPDFMSDVNFTYMGKYNQTLLQNQTDLSPFKRYSLDSKSKFSFSNQSLVFRNSYYEDFFTEDLKVTSFNGFVSHVYSKMYIKPDDLLLKNYDEEYQTTYVDNGFGETYVNVTGDRIDYNYYSEFLDGNLSLYNVKRGLLYMNAKLANESNLYAQDKKEYSDDNSQVKLYKGNGECRTWTVFDRYNTFNKMIRFSGNGNPDSVIKDSVLPNIVPMSNNLKNEKLFLTIENLAWKNYLDIDDCNYGPNGGKLMWFVPYDLSFTDNNSATYNEIEFLGRPEMVYSYKNQTNQMSLSFRLIMDTIKNFQNLNETIDTYRNFLYDCGNITNKILDNTVSTDEIFNFDSITSNTINQQTTELNNTQNYNGNYPVYYFKNNSNKISSDIDYTSGDTSTYIVYAQTGLTVITNYIKTAQYNELGFKGNDNFLSDFDNFINWLTINDKNDIFFNIKGYCSNLADNQYNKALGMRRSNELFTYILTNINYLTVKAVDNKYNIVNTVPDFRDLTSDTLKFKVNLTNGGTLNVTLITYGEENSNFADNLVQSNNPEVIRERKAVISTAYVNKKDSISTNPINPNQIKPQINNDLIQNLENSDQGAGIINNDPCDTAYKLNFEANNISNGFPTGFDKLKKYVPSFNSQTPFDFTRRYIFLKQLTRPSKLNLPNQPDNTVFGRMPVIVLRIGDFIYSKAIIKSVNFSFEDSLWDFNPEGMGAIPMYAKVTMDLVLIGGQSLKGPIDRIQTSNDFNLIANSTFSTSNRGLYRKNVEFKPAREQEAKQYKRSS